MSYRDNVSIIGKLMILEGLILLVPLLLIPFYWSERFLYWQFLVPAGLSIVLGTLISKVRREEKRFNSDRIVVFAWMYGFFLAAIPFWLYGNVNFVQAVFESVSGFTTTGLSVLNVEQTPYLFLFYRGFLQYVGGLGFVMMLLVFVQGKFSMDLYQSEGHPDRLMPNIGKTAKVICMMYTFYLVIGTGLYTMFGMEFFDSLVHAMCALSTGGFSNKLASIGYYNSFPIELITIFLMLVGTTNFSLLLLIFKGKIKECMKASELRFLVGVSVVTIPLMAIFLTAQGGYSIGGGFRQSLFNAFSAISTTGYATCSYSEWPETSVGVMVLLMIIGGGIGSTAGGIKLGRVCLMLKNLVHNIHRKILPERVVTRITYHRGTEKELVTEGQLEEASTYAFTYLLIYIAGTLALTFVAGCTLLEGAFEFASSLGTVGLSIGVTSMEASSVSLIIEIIGMVLGRLEIFVLFKALLKK